MDHGGMLLTFHAHFVYTTQDHLPRGGTTHKSTPTPFPYISQESRKFPTAMPTDQSSGGRSLIKVHSSGSLVCMKLTKTNLTQSPCLAVLILTQKFLCSVDTQNREVCFCNWNPGV